MQITNSFDSVTLKKMGISAALLAGGAVLTFLADNALKLLGAVGIPPQAQPLALAVFTWLINTAKEWVKGESGNETI